MFRIVALCALVAGLAPGWMSPALAAPPEPPPVEAYGRLPAMDLVDISPSGERLAFVASDGEGRKLFVRTVAGQPLAVVPLAEKRLRDVYWGGERFVIFLISEQRRLAVDVPASDYTAGFVLDVETRKTTPIFGRATKSWDVIMGRFGTARIDVATTAISRPWSRPAGWSRATSNSLTIFRTCSGSTWRPARSC